MLPARKLEALQGNNFTQYQSLCQADLASSISLLFYIVQGTHPRRCAC